VIGGVIPGTCRIWLSKRILNTVTSARRAPSCQRAPSSVVFATSGFSGLLAVCEFSWMFCTGPNEVV